MDVYTSYGEERIELMRFTKGKWDTMHLDERGETLKKYELKVAEAARRNAWERLCPAEYRDTCPEQLPNIKKFLEVQNWQYGPKGLLLLGPTRRGKTRAVWTRLKQLHFEERRTIIAFSPMDLKVAVARAWRDPEEAESWIDNLRTAHVLFLDDLDTIKFTEAVEETIYDIFEFRPTHKKPVIATVNQTGRELAARMNTNGRGR
jgi:DNA replication protein DnaC